MSNLVLVVDMQKGFIDPAGTLYLGEVGRAIIPHVRAILTAEKAIGSDIIFTIDTHDPDDKEFRMWPPHCIRGTWETELIPELSDWAAGAAFQHKRRYSAFFETGLHRRLEECQPERVIIAGVCTDICVLHTAADLRNRDYEVIVPANAVATFDPEAHRFALQHIMNILGGKVVPSYEAWQEEDRYVIPA